MWPTSCCRRNGWWRNVPDSLSLGLKSFDLKLCWKHVADFVEIIFITLLAYYNMSYQVLLGCVPISSSALRPLGAAYIPILLSEVEQLQRPSGNEGREAIVVGAGLCYGEGVRAYTAYTPHDNSGSWHIYSLSWNGVGLVLWSLGLKFLSQMTRQKN